MSKTNDLTAAIAELAKAGMAFTTDIRSDGKKTYIVDSVALAEDELVLLHRKGAVTRPVSAITLSITAHWELKRMQHHISRL
jgi:hypothetical protein